MQRMFSILFAIMITIAAVQTTAFAKSKATLDDEDTDSVYSWGPWLVLVRPAAGQEARVLPLTVALALGFGAGDAGQFTPDIIFPPDAGGGDSGNGGDNGSGGNGGDNGNGGGNGTPPIASGPCDPGAACGYGLIDQVTSTGPGGEVGTRTYHVIGFQNASVSLNPTPLEDGNTSGPVTLTLSSNTAVPMELMIVDQYQQTGPNKWSTYERIDVPYALDGSEGFAIITERINGVTINVAGVPFTYGLANNDTRDYTESTGILTTDKTSGAFIHGTATVLDDLDSLHAGNVQATYEGFTLRDMNPVNISVDFGNQSWNGSWNGGTDSTVTTFVDSNGVTNLTGGVGFQASGVINGPNIVSTDISATDATSISGNVNGSFFGGDAGVLAGAANIDKTTVDYSGNYQDLYVTRDPLKVGALPIPDPLGGGVE